MHESVFKYYSINQNLYNSIITNEFFFSNPREFNDPFDSNPRFKICHNENSLVNFYHYLKIQINQHNEEIIKFKNYKLISDKFKHLLEVLISINKFDDLYDFDRSIIDERLIEILTFYNNEVYFHSFYKINPIELQKKMFDDLIFLIIDFKNYGIWSGSKSSTCPVMWGHYANNHKGVCIEYELFDEKKEQNISFVKDVAFDIIDVNYSNEPIDIFELDAISLESITNTLINTKYPTWAYEKEIRLINNHQGLVKFNPKALKKIIFGYRTTPRDRYSLCKLLAHLKFEAKLYIAKPQLDNYELKIEEMKIHDIVGSGVHLNEMNLKK